MDVDTREFARGATGSWRTTGAQLIAVLHALAGAIGALGCLALLLGGERAYESLAFLGASLFVGAIGVGCLCRVDAARLFIAGEFALLTLGFVVAFLALVFDRFGCASLFVLIPLALSALGAMIFVSTDVRAWCRRS